MERYTREGLDFIAYFTEGGRQRIIEIAVKEFYIELSMMDGIQDIIGYILEAQKCRR